MKSPKIHTLLIIHPVIYKKLELRRIEKIYPILNAPADMK